MPPGQDIKFQAAALFCFCPDDTDEEEYDRTLGESTMARERRPRVKIKVCGKS